MEWAEDIERSFETAITVAVHNNKGALAKVAAAISGAEADIVHISMDDEERSAEVAELKLAVNVRDRVHLAEVMRALRRSAPVVRVARVNQSPVVAMAM